MGIYQRKAAERSGSEPALFVTAYISLP